VCMLAARCRGLLLIRDSADPVRNGREEDHVVSGSYRAMSSVLGLRIKRDIITFLLIKNPHFTSSYRTYTRCITPYTLSVEASSTDLCRWNWFSLPLDPVA
jgi:hypothetical protein